MKKIIAFTGIWHKNVSSAFKELVFEPLREKIEFDHRVFNRNNIPVLDTQIPIVFCQAPPIEFAEKNPKQKVVWIPMWDDARHLSDVAWANTPKNIRILALSEHLANRARQAGLTVLQVQYYKDPDNFPHAQWNGERTLFYWNRTGMIGPAFLEKICETLKLDRLIFRGDIDPIFKENIRYQLPERLGQTVVETLPFMESKEAYYRAVDRANIVIAPRLSEGVGMVFLEALARGCAVLAFDGPTMNEYITSGVDGHLFPIVYASDKDRSSPDFKKKVLTQYSVSDLQNWAEIGGLDLKRLGDQARINHESGFSRWTQSLDKIEAFLTEW